MSAVPASELYSSFGQVAGEYSRHRPNWPKDFAVHTLEQMGFQHRRKALWENHYDQTPVVVCVGAGAGSDAATFLEMGCKVYLVDVDKDMLNQAWHNLWGIEKDVPNAKAVYVHSDALHMGDAVKAQMPEGEVVHGIVFAQSFHSMNETFSGKFKTAAEQQAGKTAEELIHRSCRKIMPGEGKVFAWFYNPVARESLRTLDALLKSEAPSYRDSRTPFLNAEGLKPNYLQSLIRATAIEVSELMPVDDVTLRADEIGPWLKTYSFAPKDEAELARVAGVLKTEWFDKFAEGGQITVPYVGAVYSGPLREKPYRGDTRASVPVRDRLFFADS